MPHLKCVVNPRFKDSGLDTPALQFHPQSMLTASSRQELRDLLQPSRAQNRRIVFVPTMGALHSGHTSLFDQARDLAGPDGTVVASIFVNPIQFNNPSDLATYPQQLDQDSAACAAHGVDILFAPSASEMYAPDRSISITESSLSQTLCGASRPGHFAGVCTVVAKLFNLVQPSDAIFGKKDYQQLAILRRLVRDLDIPVNIHGAEIVREPSGLALSSRNQRLSPDQKSLAPKIFQALQSSAAACANGNRDAIQLASATCDLLAQIPGTAIDYVAIVDASTLQPVQTISSPSLLAVAVFFGEVRLIDNIELP